MSRVSLTLDWAVEFIGNRDGRGFADVGDVTGGSGRESGDVQSVQRGTGRPGCTRRVETDVPRESVRVIKSQEIPRRTLRLG